MRYILLSFWTFSNLLSCSFLFHSICMVMLFCIKISVWSLFQGFIVNHDPEFYNSIQEQTRRRTASLPFRCAESCCWPDCHLVFLPGCLPSWLPAFLVACLPSGSVSLGFPWLSCTGINTVAVASFTSRKKTSIHLVSSRVFCRAKFLNSSWVRVWVG